MLSDTELEMLSKSLPLLTPVQEMAAEIMQKVKRCLFCNELFPATNLLSEHLRQDHDDKFTISCKKQIRNHLVFLGDNRIYICPYCHFAVGENKRQNATSIITSHVPECRMNFSKNSGRPRLTFNTSEDNTLIANYLNGHEEIELFKCQMCENQAFGSADALAEHFLAREHSLSSLEKLSEEQSQHIFQVLQEIMDSRATLRTTHPVIPISMPKTEMVEPSALDSTSGRKLSPTMPDLSPANIGNGTLVGHVFSSTVGQTEIEGGFIHLPKRLASCFGLVEPVKVYLAGNKENTVLRLDLHNGSLKDLTVWFLDNAIEPGDRIKFQLLSLEPPVIWLWTEWEKHLNYVFQCPAEDFKWKHFSIRDCLIKVFANHQEPIHYRSLYSQISRHRDVEVTSVIATLSKYRDVLFAHIGSGTWSRVEGDAETDPALGRLQSRPRGEIGSLEVISETIWKIVAEIEKGDAVYNLLKRNRDSLSFDQICQKIAEARAIDWHELQHTGFLNAQDERLKRLDNGHFALREWFDEPVSPLTVASTENIDLPHQNESEAITLVEKSQPLAPTTQQQIESLSTPAEAKSLLMKVWSFLGRILGIIIRRHRKRSNG